MIICDMPRLGTTILAKNTEPVSCVQQASTTRVGVPSVFSLTQEKARVASQEQSPWLELLYCTATVCPRRRIRCTAEHLTAPCVSTPSFDELILPYSSSFNCEKNQTTFLMHVYTKGCIMRIDGRRVQSFDMYCTVQVFWVEEKYSTVPNDEQSHWNLFLSPGICCF